MNRRHRRVAARSLLVWLVVSTAAAAVLALVASMLDDPAPSLDEYLAFEEHLVRVAAVTLGGCAAWLWVITTAVIADGLRAQPATRLVGVPRRWRHAVLLACGLALAGAATLAPAGAALGASGEEDTDGPRLSGLPMPERPEGGLRPSPPPPGTAPDTPPDRAPLPAPTGPARTHRVAPGQSLWSIAAADLAGDLHEHPREAAIAEHLHRLYQRNRDVIGPEPNLIHPGQRLLLPPADPTISPK